MFTGIVEEMGMVENLVHKDNLVVLKVRAQKVFKDATLGSSIAVNGVCLTVTGRHRNVLSFDVMLETLRKTTLGALQPTQSVNLERALRANGRLDGHFVGGHVDGVGRIKGRRTAENYTQLQIAAPLGLMKYIAPKGSVAIDGVSLTIGEVRKSDFLIYLIPLTLEATTLRFKNKGDQVNIETDILAKYILKDLKATNSGLS